MARSFFSYVKSAFSARPLGMPIPPNWVALAAVVIAALGFNEPGFLLIGAGAELGYLLWLSSSKRFQRFVDAANTVQKDDRERIDKMVASLPAPDARQYQLISIKCREILQQQQSHGVDVAAQEEALSRLVLIYLQLQVTRQNLLRLLQQGSEEDIPARIDSVQKQLQKQTLSPELRNSLEGQLEILQHRLAGRTEAADKLQFVNAELIRIQEQIELVREQSMLSTDPAALTERIDGITGSLTQTGQWIRDQQRIIGRLEDISADPPPLLGPDAQKEAQ